MDKFSKFLENNEELALVAKRRQNSQILKLIIFLLLPAIFFLLYPLLQAGRPGLFLWLLLLLLWLIILIRQTLQQEGVYLLTNRRIIHLRLKNKDNYIIAGQLALVKIISLAESGRSNLCLWTKHDRFYLVNLENREKIYQYLISLKQQNLV